MFLVTLFTSPALLLAVHLQVLLGGWVSRALVPTPPRRASGDDGQTTAEYALVLLGAAAIALLLVAWATRSDRIGQLFDWVLGEIMGRAS